MTNVRAAHREPLAGDLIRLLRLARNPATLMSEPQGLNTGNDERDHDEDRDLFAKLKLLCLEEARGCTEGANGAGLNRVSGGTPKARRHIDSFQPYNRLA